MSDLIDIDANESARIVRAYLSGITVGACVKTLGVPRCRVRRVLLQAGVMRTNREKVLLWRRAKPGVHGAFVEMNQACAYWLGFLFADGHVSKALDSVALELSSSDNDHLLRFRDYAGGSRRRSMASAEALDC